MNEDHANTKRSRTGRLEPSIPREEDLAMPMRSRTRTTITFLCGFLLLQGCNVGPKYSRPSPSAEIPATFKEVTPEDLKQMDGWKVAQPQDSTLHGKWWEIFGDPELNSLEDQVDISNQNVA